MRNFERYPRPSQIANSPTNFVCRLYNNEAPSGLWSKWPVSVLYGPFDLCICKINILIRPEWTINPINWMKKSFPFGMDSSPLSSCEFINAFFFFLNKPKFWKHIRDDIVTKLNWSRRNKFQIDPPPTVLVIVGNGLWSNPFM